ncbi:MAG: endonuclease III domain-containing protein [bacterium]
MNNRTKNKNIDRIISILRNDFTKYKKPSVTQVAEAHKDPFKVLISCILSLRTKDEVTNGASSRLFKVADTPEKIAQLPTHQMEELIYPVGFYKTKSQRIGEIAHTLIKEYNSKVPDDINELLKLKGVGRKTANLVITLGYGKEGICVDTHVHRISNRLGLVNTKTPEQTEFALRQILPKKYWLIYNDLLVTWGQNICVPISPFCSQCSIKRYCRMIGVKKSR